MDKKRVLVLCTGNSARSQMAEGFLWHMEGNKLEVFSAEGVPPKNLVRKESLPTIWCGRRELNPQGLPHTLLKRTRMPVPPLPHY